ncbi:MAG: alpha/beta hydrolase [Acidimicrobiales bacterium]|nr:alpha/beta hydrolase [Acidimicrobiales bacterium]
MGSPHLSWHKLRVQGRRAEVGLGGDGPIVVLLHGWAVSGRTYRKAHHRLLEQGYRVVAPSLPGFGSTTALPRHDLDLAGYAEWVAALLDELGVDEPAAVLGHSFGGGVAVQLATEHPGRVRALVLVNSVGGSVWRPEDDDDATQHLADRPIWDWGLHFTREARNVLPVVARDILRNVVINPRSFVRVAGLARRADLRAQLEALRDRDLPIVVLWGDEDRILPRSSLVALAAAGGADTRVISGRHSWLITHPETFAEAMTNVAGMLGPTDEPNQGETSTGSTT